MNFTKMQGLGNDYIYVDCTQNTPENLPALAVAVSHRHYGVGGDGLICICPSQQGDFRMRMFNADGSEGEMCGNGIRCLGKFVYDKGLTAKTKLTIETAAGLRPLTLVVTDGVVRQVTVDMGAPGVEDACQVTVLGQAYDLIPVSMGNPHAVHFTQGIQQLDLPILGPHFERNPRFPNRVNTEFAHVLAPNHITMRVWERGSGETLACGTGACAVAVAGVVAGLTQRAVTVTLLGGDLDIRWQAEDNHVYMTGPAVTVFEGNWSDQ